MARLLFLLIVLKMDCQMQLQKTNENSVTQNGMTVTWTIESDYLHIEARAPTQGWVAIGFNIKEGLQGTNLIMGAVKNGKVHIEDQWIVAVGEHKSILDLGGQDLLLEKAGKENAKGTTITFRIPLQATDDFHHNLEKGKAYHLLMAFSREDDFTHHSMIRTSVKIIL